MRIWFEKKYEELFDPIEKKLNFRTTFYAHFYGEAKE